MKLRAKLACLATAAVLVPMQAAEATIYRFTLSSDLYGALGFMEYNSSAFDGTSWQAVENSMILNLYFTAPITGKVYDTPGPADHVTYFDSTGSLPAVAGGGGTLAGTDYDDGVLIWNSGTPVSFDGVFYEVTWNTTAVSSAVPEASTWAMMLLGFGAVGYGMRRRRRSGNAVSQIA